MELWDPFSPPLIHFSYLCLLPLFPFLGQTTGVGSAVVPLVGPCSHYVTIEEFRQTVILYIYVQ